MSDKIKDGGPAFPPIRLLVDGDRFTRIEGPEGMSLRDWFAGMALQGLLACPQVRQVTKPLKDESTVIASEAFDYADAMLAEREKGTQ